MQVGARTITQNPRAQSPVSCQFEFFTKNHLGTRPSLELFPLICSGDPERFATAWCWLGPCLQLQFHARSGARPPHRPCTRSGKLQRSWLQQRDVLRISVFGQLWHRFNRDAQRLRRIRVVESPGVLDAIGSGHVVVRCVADGANLPLLGTCVFQNELAIGLLELLANRLWKVACNLQFLPLADQGEDFTSPTIAIQSCLVRGKTNRCFISQCLRPGVRHLPRPRRGSRHVLGEITQPAQVDRLQIRPEMGGLRQTPIEVLHDTLLHRIAMVALRQYMPGKIRGRAMRKPHLATGVVKSLDRRQAADVPVRKHGRILIRILSCPIGIVVIDLEFLQQRRFSAHDAIKQFTL